MQLQSAPPNSLPKPNNATEHRKYVATEMYLVLKHKRKWPRPSAFDLPSDIECYINEGFWFTKEIVQPPAHKYSNFPINSKIERI